LKQLTGKKRKKRPNVNTPECEYYLSLGVFFAVLSTVKCFPIFHNENMVKKKPKTDIAIFRRLRVTSKISCRNVLSQRDFPPMGR
jgi:hypothetical protein